MGIAWRLLSAPFTLLQPDGQHSMENAVDFEHYQASTSRWRALAVCVLTPIPSIAVMCLIDCIQLSPIERGLKGSLATWVRLAIVYTVSVTSVFEQFRYHARGFLIKWQTKAIITFVGCTVTIVSTYGIASLIGYPVPFTFVVSSGPWYIVYVPLLLVLERQQIFGNREVARDLLNYHIYLAFLFAMMVLYVIFNLLFRGLPPANQNTAMLLFPLIKWTAKKVWRRIFHVTDDAKAEINVFSVGIFHALFASFCLQSTASFTTVYIVIALDVVQSAVSVYKIFSCVTMLRKKAGEDHRTNIIKSSPVESSQVLRASHNVKVAPVDPSRNKAPSASKEEPFFPSAIVPRNGYAMKSAVALTPANSDQHLGEHNKLICRLYFSTEYVALVEYSEVIMPTIYCCYLSVLAFLPNRHYYPFLHDRDGHAVQVNAKLILFYGFLEFLSLVVLALVLWWRLQISLLYHLAFVLERRCGNIMAKIVMFTAAMMQFSIDQFGNDYSFKFAWLYSETSG